jgi:hypothetical protein
VTDNGPPGSGVDQASFIDVGPNSTPERKAMELLRKKTALIGIAIALGIVALGAAGGAAATPLDPFLGTWWAIDPSDGSLEQVTFGANGALFFRDDSAHTCGGVQALLNDVGTVSDNTWTGSGTAILRCPAVGQTVAPIFFQFTLNPDGALSGVGPEVWTRVLP